MIGRLIGTVVTEDGDGTLLLDVGGVGYEIAAPLGTLGRARTDDGRMTLHVHTHVREDALSLYGFATLEDKGAFRTLIGLPNVGPKIALAVLSAMPADELARAVAREDRARLNAIAGVGKKTVERLLVELKDKLHAPASAASPPSRAAAGAALAPSKAEQLASALAHLGFRPVQVERAMDALRAELDAAPLPDLIRQALALLAR